MKSEQPLWGKGIMLSPQHFQQQIAYQSWRDQIISQMGLTHPWGLFKANFDQGALKLGRLKANCLTVCFQDGTIIDSENSDPLPPTLSLSEASGVEGDVVVLLALPMLYANGNNLLDSDEIAQRPVRYRKIWSDVRDLHTDEVRQLATIKPELSLRFEYQENNDYLTCPVARLKQDMQGQWTLDPNFLAPALMIQTHEFIVNALDQLLVQLRARLNRLMAMRRENNERMADFAVADVSLFWLLNSLNSSEPVLSHYLRYLQTPIETLYLELSRLAGSLLTFSLEHNVSDIPSYQHDNLNSVFPPLFDLISTLLEASLPSRVLSIDLEHNPRVRQWSARLHEPRLRDGADYYLSVRSTLPAVELQEKFIRQCKVGSPDAVRSLVNSSQHGIPLKPLSHVPAAIPLRLENQYFSLDLNHPSAQSMLDSGHCVFYVPGTLGDIELELFAVLRT